MNNKKQIAKVLEQVFIKQLNKDSELTRQLTHLVKYWVVQFNEEEVTGDINIQRERFVEEIINIINKEAK